MKLLPAIPHPLRPQSGMTLMEVLVSAAIGTVIMGVTVALLIFAARSLKSLGNYDELNSKSRNTLDVMSRDIRQAQRLTGYVSNGTVQTLTFANVAGVAPTNFSYHYVNPSGSNGTLTRIWGASSKVVLENINYLHFHLSQRNPVDNFAFFPATNIADAKLIDVSWKCSLPVGGAAIINSESIQTAKIVIRN